MNTFAWIGSDGDGASGCRTSRRGCLRSHGSQTPFVGGRWHGSSPRGVRAVPCPSAASFGAGRSRASTPGPALAWGCCNTPGGELVGKRGSRRKREKCGRDEAVPWSSGVPRGGGGGRWISDPTLPTVWSCSFGFVLQLHEQGLSEEGGFLHPARRWQCPSVAAKNMCAVSGSLVHFPGSDLPSM